MLHHHIGCKSKLVKISAAQEETWRYGNSFDTHQTTNVITLLTPEIVHFLHKGVGTHLVVSKIFRRTSSQNAAFFQWSIQTT